MKRKSHAGCIEFLGHSTIILTTTLISSFHLAVILRFAQNICQVVPSPTCCKRPPRGVDKLLKRYRRCVTHSHSCVCRFMDFHDSATLSITHSCEFNAHATVSRSLRLMRRSTTILDVRSLATLYVGLLLSAPHSPP